MASKGVAQTIFTLKYNMIIEYYADNFLGAKIYVDMLSRFPVRVKDHETESMQ